MSLLRALRPLSSAASTSRRLAAPTSSPSPSITTPALGRRSLCLPPFRSSLEASDDPLPPDYETLESCKFKPDVSAADGITPEAALAELRKLDVRNCKPADLGIHTPTPIAPFTDVDPLTGKLVGKEKKGFFSKRA